MSDKTNEQLEHEAREALVAADLSAKMKHWRDQPPPSDGGSDGSALFRILLLLLAFGGAAWWFWPKAKDPLPPQQEFPAAPSAPVPSAPAPEMPEKSTQAPMAQTSPRNQYLALAQSAYQAPNFAHDIRGDAPKKEDALNTARQALANGRPANALEALQQAPPDYQTDANYLRAHALFQLKKYAESATVFKNLRSSVRYGESAQWYEILALLPGFETKKPVISTKLQKIIGDQQHTYQREASQLLKELKQQ